MSEKRLIKTDWLLVYKFGSWHWGADTFGGWLELDLGRVGIDIRYKWR